MPEPGDNEPILKPTEPYARVHDVQVTCYGDNIVHPRLPALAIHAKLRNLAVGQINDVAELFVCDGYDALADLGRMITRLAEERAGKGDTVDSPSCTRCGNELGDDDFFEDGETRPRVVIDGDQDPPVTRGPYCMPCFRLVVGLDRPATQPAGERIGWTAGNQGSEPRPYVRGKGAIELIAGPDGTVRWTR